MSLPRQEYANLAEHTYDRKGDLRSEVGKEVVLEGVKYKVLEYVDKLSSGYQGTIFQRSDTGEIVVAHRGTEFGRELMKDGVQADGGMVLNRTNSQATDAIALTRRALDMAKDPENMIGGRISQVSVTGHSLGGTLAQITAHHFDLHGETFNAYGAVSLGYRIPEGGDRMVNHVMAGDPVSAASKHYGQVRVYAQQSDIDALKQGGYLNTRLPIDLAFRSELAGVVRLGGTHSMHNFLNVDGDVHKDVSPLRDPATLERAQDNKAMIDKYRSDLHDTRSAVTLLGRSPPGHLRDLYDTVRGPLPAGEPARREEAEKHRQENRALPPLPSMRDQPYDGAQHEPRRGDDAMTAKFREHLPPGTSDDKIAHLMLQTRQQTGITEPDRIASITTRGDDVFVMGVTQGFRVKLSLAEPAPPLAQTHQQMVAFDQHQAHVPGAEASV